MQKNSDLYTIMVCATIINQLTKQSQETATVASSASSDQPLLGTTCLPYRRVFHVRRSVLAIENTTCASATVNVRQK